MSGSNGLPPFPSIGLIDERHLAREVNALRGDVQQVLAAIDTRVLPAIDGLGTRLGKIEVRVDALERHSETIPARSTLSMSAGWIVALLVVASVGIVGGVAFVAARL